MRIFEDLSQDEQYLFIRYLRENDIDINTADEYEILEEKEALEYIEKYVSAKIDDINCHIGRFHESKEKLTVLKVVLKTLEEAMKEYDVDEFFIEIGVGMFIKREGRR